MTTETTTKKKVQATFYIFSKDEEGNNLLIGSAFAHKKGKGMNLIIHDERFVAFPPNPNTKKAAE